MPAKVLSSAIIGIDAYVVDMEETHLSEAIQYRSLDRQLWLEWLIIIN